MWPPIEGTNDPFKRNGSNVSDENDNEIMKRDRERERERRHPHNDTIRNSIEIAEIADSVDDKHIDALERVRMPPRCRKCREDVLAAAAIHIGVHDGFETQPRALDGHVFRTMHMPWHKQQHRREGLRVAKGLVKIKRV